MFVLQVTGIDWQPSVILTRGLDSLRGAMPGRQAIGWWRRGSSLLSYASPPHAQHSSAFLMRPEDALEWAAEGALRRPVLLLTRPRLCLPPVQRWPIHPDNALTTHLAAVRCETHQSCPMVSAHNDSVDQTMARSLGDVIENQWRSCVPHSPAGFFLKGLLEKTVCQNGAGVLGRLKSLSLSIYALGN